MAIKHVFQSSKTDGSDTTKVQPSNWNADHNHVPFSALTISPGAALITWTNMPAALTEFLGIPRLHRLQVDLTYATQVRLIAQLSTAGLSGSQLRGQYWDGAGWQYLDGGTGPSVTLTTAGDLDSGWVTLAAGAKLDRVLRIAGINGDGIADPVFGLIQLQVK